MVDPNEIAKAVLYAAESAEMNWDDDVQPTLASFARCLHDAYVTNHDDRGSLLCVPLEHWEEKHADA